MSPSASWPKVRLGDVVRIKHGFAFSGMAETTDTSLPVVLGIGNFDYAGGFRLGSTTLKRYGGDYPKEYELKPGDVLLAMTCQTSGGEILGVPGVIPDDEDLHLHNQRLGKVEVLDPARVLLPFIFQLCRWSAFNRHLFDTASGSKILHTSPGRIEDFEFGLPPLEEQRTIAATAEGFVIRHRACTLKTLVLTPRSAELHHKLPPKKAADTSKMILSPMPGLVVTLDVTVGQQVRSGEQVAIIEAMKMQNIIRAERDGVVKSVGAKSGDSVAADEVLVEFA